MFLLWVVRSVITFRYSGINFSMVIVLLTNYFIFFILIIIESSIKMRVCNVSKILSFILLLTFFSLSFCCVSIVNASDNDSIKECEYTEEYLNWLLLSDEEKKNTIRPEMCAYDIGSTNRLKYSLDLQTTRLKAALPTSYDLRDTEYMSVIKDQMNTGQCWAFSGTTALEIFTKVSLGLDYVYSPRHIEYATTRYFLNDEENEWGFNRGPGDGGHTGFLAGYFSSQVGPVLESEMPFENNENYIEISEIQNKTKLIDVNGMVKDGSSIYIPCTSEHILKMKEQIYNSGSVVSSVYVTDDSNYLNPVTAALYYNGDEYSNHSITVIGWDDDYSKDSFASTNKPSSNGAWIVQNSYGEDSMDNGFFYVSYEDERICSSYLSFVDIDTDVEDNAYIYDKLGFNSVLGWDDSDGNMSGIGYGMNIFTKEAKKELLKEVSFVTYGPGTYKIYYKEGDASSTSVTNMTEIASGTLDYKGYYTHHFDEPIVLDSSVTKFSIVVYWDLSINMYPIAAASNQTYDYQYLEMVDNVSYVSYSGRAGTWTDMYNSNYVLSIKAFTDDIKYTFTTSGNTVTEGNSDNIVLNVTYNNVEVDTSKLKYVVRNSSGDEITSFNVSHSTNSEGLLNASKLDFYNGLDNGSYQLYVYYDGSYVETVQFSVEFGIISAVYTVSRTDGVIYISSPVQVSTFLNNITGNEGTVYKAGVLVSDGYVATGMTVDDYIIVLLGDVDADGEIAPMDYIKIKNHIMNTTLITGKYLKLAADANGDSNIDPLDYVRVKNYIMEKGSG